MQFHRMPATVFLVLVIACTSGNGEEIAPQVLARDLEVPHPDATHYYAQESNSMHKRFLSRPVRQVKFGPGIPVLGGNSASTAQTQAQSTSINLGPLGNFGVSQSVAQAQSQTTGYSGQPGYPYLGQGFGNYGGGCGSGLYPGGGYYPGGLNGGLGGLNGGLYNGGLYNGYNGLGGLGGYNPGLYGGGIGPGFYGRSASADKKEPIKNVQSTQSKIKFS